MPDGHEIRILRRRLFIATVTLSAVLIAAFALAAASFYIGHRNAVAANHQAQHDRVILCRAQNRSTEALRNVLLLAQSLAARTQGLSPRERERAVRFYRDALALVKPLNCRTITGSPTS